MDKKTSTGIIIVFVLCALFVAGLILYVNKKQSGETLRTDYNYTPRCTQEAKVCPDGSSVGRTGPNCEFVACPGEKDVSSLTNSNIDLTNWKTYKNDRYKYSIKYPAEWFIESEVAMNDLYCPEEELKKSLGMVGCNGAPLNISNYPNPTQYYESNHKSRVHGDNEKILEYPKDFEELSLLVYNEGNLNLTDFMRENPTIFRVDDNHADWDNQSWKIQQSEVSINGTKGIKRVATQNESIIVDYLLEKSGIVFYIGYNGNNPIIDQIVSTFETK